LVIGINCDINKELYNATGFLSNLKCLSNVPTHNVNVLPISLYVSIDGIV